MDDDEKLGCPECDSLDYELKNTQRVKDPGHFIVTVETRECNKCGKTYRVANNGLVEYYQS